jgi:hypothetical protein
VQEATKHEKADSGSFLRNGDCGFGIRSATG